MNKLKVLTGTVPVSFGSGRKFQNSFLNAHVLTGTVPVIQKPVPMILRHVLVHNNSGSLRILDSPFH